MKTKPKLARMGGEEEMNGNGLNITIGVDLAPMMRMVVVKLASGSGGKFEEKKRKKDEPNIQLRGQFKTKIYVFNVFIRVSKKNFNVEFCNGQKVKAPFL